MSYRLGTLLPPRVTALERRLHRRAVLHWRNALGDGDLVVLERFDPLAIEDRSNHGFLLDLRGEEAMVVYAGPTLAEEAGLSGGRIPLASVSGTSLLAIFADHYPRVVDSAAPQTAAYDFVTRTGRRMLCRGALLPLSADGKRVDHVYGVVSWKSEKVRIAKAGRPRQSRGLAGG